MNASPGSGSVELTPEQRNVVEHPHTDHGRVLAGPGTGKSLAAVAFLKRLDSDHPDVRAQMVTFTRAAAKEFDDKLVDSALGDLGADPQTVHALALGLIGRTERADVPRPIRIPDIWERRNLIRPVLSRRLRDRGFGEVTAMTVKKKLEPAMAAEWQDLKRDTDLEEELQPGLREAYIGEWRHHRRQFGYTLLAELPALAGDVLADKLIDVPDPDVLVVDEFQDLNHADIRLIRLLAERGVAVLAIGDEDQSIYRFRYAAREGIQNFPDEFNSDRDYELRVGQRCGRQILRAAGEVIGAAPGRERQRALRAADRVSDGYYAYARFDDHQREADGVAELVAARREVGVPSGKIVILARSSISSWWEDLAPALSERGIKLASTGWVKQTLLEDRELRKGLAVARLAVNLIDSLAWRTLIDLEANIGSGFVNDVLDNAEPDETFGKALLRQQPLTLLPELVDGRWGVVSRYRARVEQLDISVGPEHDAGWASWVIDLVDADQLTDQGVRLLTEVAAEVPPTDGLASFLNELEPTGKDLATTPDAGVRLMTMASAKGLTVDTAIVVGVEDSLLPHPKADDPEVERRLLYVAMTRAENVCVLTMAGDRRDSAAVHSGDGHHGRRGHCRFLSGLRAGRQTPGPQVVQEVAGRATA